MFMWMCIVSEMVWCTSFFVWGQGTRRKIIPFVCGFGHKMNYFSALCTGSGKKCRS